MDSVTLNFWLISSVMCKLLILLAIAGVVGGSFSLLLAQYLGLASRPILGSYLFLSALIGIGATLLSFLAQIGAINQAGLAGMRDWNMAVILADTKSGYASGLRLFGFAGVLSAWFWQYHRQESSGHGRLQTGGTPFLLLGLALVLSASFMLVGHVSTLAGIVRVAIGVHVFAVFLWVGSLWPLLHLSTDADLTKVQKLMKVFGTSALWIVGLLFLSGLFLLTQLVRPLSELLTTPYGLSLSLKLLGFTCLLALAGINKLLLVPRLTTGDSIRLLRASIRTEIAVALFILAVTSWLTTAVGPAA